MRKAVFPGSFDPVTNGHIDVITRAASLFDELVVALGENTQKRCMFPSEKRLQWLREALADMHNVHVISYEGLTVDFCRSVDATYVVRGLRSAADYEYERMIAQINHEMEPLVETVFISTSPAFAAVSSTIVREIIRNKGDVSKFVPPSVRW
jgi:pantetheine-phosphate adenylyltransferase